MVIKEYENKQDIPEKANDEISGSLLMRNNFTENQLIRLSAFLREDELHIDDIVETGLESLSDSFKIKQDAMESGRIELQKISQPRLQFSMTMANIYALPEFEPIIHQFQLGKVIRVALRPDYIKQSRLLQIDINFDDFSDFSVEFGELTNLRTQSDIHADLLSNAITAGKSVATNSSAWTKGSDLATAIDLKIQKGLLDAATQIKAIDGTQSVSIDKYGIHLRKKKGNSEEYEDEQGWIVNNQFLYSDDAFKTSKSVFGKYRIPTKTIDGEQQYEEKWGLLAEAVIAGYIEGSTVKGSEINGGTIQIGLQEDGSYAFEVHENGSVTMNGGSSIDGYVKEDDFNKQIDEIKSTSTIISDVQPVDANEGQLWLNTSVEPYSLMVFTNGEWAYFSQNEGEKIYTSQPTTYSTGDLWILSVGESYTAEDVTYGAGSILRADENLNWTDAVSGITSVISNVNQYFNFDKSTGLRIGQKDDKFHVNLSSTKMGFYDGDTEVVQISNKSANIDDLTVEYGFTADCSSTFNGDMTVTKEINGNNCSFVWKVEDSNGSFSLAIMS